MHELRLDPVGPQMVDVEGTGRMMGLLSLATLGKQLKESCCTDATVPEAASVAETPVDNDAVQTEVMGNLHDDGMTNEEHHLCMWFRESHCMAKHALNAALAQEEGVVWHPCDKSAYVVMLSHERMKRIGMVYEDGSTPNGPDPLPLYWIQAKPEDVKEQFGAWDPVNARWRIHEKRTVVPIERRYAPINCGYGTDLKEPKEQVCKTHDFFTDYEELELYDNTGLEPGVEYIQLQAESLPMGHMLGAEHGWGESALGDAVLHTTAPPRGD